MTETTKNSGEKLSVTPTKTLTLKRAGVEQGVVRQSFSHGRSKAVVVEKVKRRVAGPGEVKAEPAAPAPDRSAAPKRAGAPAKPIAAAVAPATAAPAIAPKASGVVLRTLTDDERNARAHALADARLRETEERERAEEEARVRRTREESERVDRAAAEARKLNEEVRRKHDEETKRKADEVAKKRFGADVTTAAKPGARPALEADEEEAPRTARRGGSATPRPAPAPKPTRNVGEK
ncbi:MAG: translation initiation factor IF-2 associated domain-containing protein, partial [Xanthobacteraceae bacterium]